MDMGKFLIETHLQTGRSIKELAAAHDVSARRLFKLLRRYRLEGPAGLEPRSRRPHRSPHADRRCLRGRDRRVDTRRSLTTDSMPGPPPSTSTCLSVTAPRPRSRPSSGSSKPGASSPSNPTSARRARSRRAVVIGIALGVLGTVLVTPGQSLAVPTAIVGASRRRDRLGVMGSCLVPGETTGRLDPRRGSGGRDRVGLPLDVRVRTPRRHRMVERDRTRSGHLQQVAALFSKQPWNVAPTALHPS